MPFALQELCHSVMPFSYANHVVPVHVILCVQARLGPLSGDTFNSFVAWSRVCGSPSLSRSASTGSCDATFQTCSDCSDCSASCNASCSATVSSPESCSPKMFKCDQGCCMILVNPQTSAGSPFPSTSLPIPCIIDSMLQMDSGSAQELAQQLLQEPLVFRCDRGCCMIMMSHVSLQTTATIIKPRSTPCLIQQQAQAQTQTQAAAQWHPSSQHSRLSELLHRLTDDPASQSFISEPTSDQRIKFGASLRAHTLVRCAFICRRQPPLPSHRLDYV